MLGRSDFEKVCEECEKPFSSFIETICDDCHHQHQEGLINEIKQLQAKLDKAVGALEFYSDTSNICLYEDISWDNNFLCERCYKPQRLDRFGKLARETLAELEADNAGEES